MKYLILATLVALSSINANAGAPKKYFCTDDDGSDWSAEIDFTRSTARLMAENVDSTYRYSMTLESNPPQHIFGDQKDCYINFQPSRDGSSGTAKFRCNKRKYPRSVELDLQCGAAG